MRRLNRRMLLERALAALPLAALPGLAAAAPTPSGRRLLAGLGIRDVTAAAGIGRRYLARHPAEAAAVRELAQRLAATPSRRRRDLLVGLRETDLERGDSVIVDGWVLARSEARLLALATVA